MPIKDTLFTVLLSVGTTLVVTHFLNGHSAIPAHAASQETVRELTVDRLIVRKELIVSDTGSPWDTGFESQQIPRGLVARSLAPDENGRPGTAGLWVRSRLIKSEIDDPFDDRFHAVFLHQLMQGADVPEHGYATALRG